MASMNPDTVRIARTVYIYATTQSLQRQGYAVNLPKLGLVYQLYIVFTIGLSLEYVHTLILAHTALCWVLLLPVQQSLRLLC